MQVQSELHDMAMSHQCIQKRELVPHPIFKKSYFKTNAIPYTFIHQCLNPGLDIRKFQKNEKNQNQSNILKG